ncbi:FecR domain-containing protein [Bradyrhizobium sp. CCBAU 11386]|uniref:FecR domain-containing protein n=1 Tax=Bradyrhizobium sp. CCBAU 11386 TaxID=1630837 RepID=UPI002302AD70|nr:FecR domain-containing protein [Bradyrhizobium sp. CCBAU 11386]
MPGDVHGDSFTAKPFIAKAHGHVPDGAFVVPDPNLIFKGEFKRAGLDLVLSHEGHEFVVHDYFRGDKRAAIASPDGAHLTGDIVSALTGHVQYAQATPGAAAAQVIGHVTKLSGSATAVRNGVSVILNNGDNVEKGDVVSTGADSTLGITFIDGTVFGLSSNARMVLNEMVYDPNGSNNSSLLSLVAGTITFVAGETAKHGDMKIDTPVATMGIRGTAVLTQINFVVPAGGGDPQPQASFQVLVEPNGTTGSYILFDKVTLLPIATVNQAGQMIQISGGNVSITNALMSPDVQKLITDVFTLKFTDNNSNTKLTTNFTDTITQTSQDLVFKSGSGAVVIATFVNLNPQGPEAPGNSTPSATRVPGQPLAQSLDLGGNVKKAFALTERADTTGDRADATGDTVGPDAIIFRITFVDQNLGDRPTVSVSLADAPNYVYMDAGHHDVTGLLSALQKQDIAATQIQIGVVADGGNNNNGSAILTYTIPDHVFDFLAAGETLTLTYMVRVDTNFEVNPESAFIPITITITGTNDKPVISTSVPVITFEGGTSVPGGPLSSDVPTSGTLDFTDVDLTDKHTVSVALTSATLPDGSTVPPGPLAAFQSAMSVAIAAGADSTGDGTGTINWSLADLPVYLADFIPEGEVLTLTYTVTLTDSQGAISQQTITVTITGTDAPAVVWIATDNAGAPSGGFWKDAANWETGTVPTINDDVIVITDQLHGLTPSYPVSIDSAAYAKSVTMNDFGGPPPKLINQSSLTISGALNMGADSILTNAVTGTMSVGGKAEILDTSVFTNAGYLTLQGGGDFASGTTITNSGTIELSGGTLNMLADIANAGGTLKADAGTTLIVDTATVDGGTVTILGTLELDGTSLIENGALNNSGTVNVKGTAEFAHESVSNTSTGTIKVLANGWLTVDQGSSVTNNGAVTVDASGKLTVNGATISGVGTVTDNGEIDLTGNAVLSGGSLNNNAVFKVSGASNALDHETITNAGTIEVLANGALTIDQGSTVANTGNITVDATGKLTVNGATISGAGTITDNGEIDLTGNAVLSGGILTNTAAFKVSGASNALDHETITNAGTIEVLANGALAIDQGSTVANTGSVTVDATGKLTVNGATISGAGTITDNGEIDLTGNAVLSGGSLTNNAAFKVSGASNALDHETITNAGTIEVLANGALTIDQGSTVANTGNVTVDASGKLTVNGATISGAGTVTDNGEIDLTGNAVVSGGILNNNAAFKVSGTGNALDHETITNATTGTIEVLANGALAIDQGSTVANTGNITVDATGKLTVNGATISGAGTVTDSGEIDLTGNAVLSGGILANTATFKVSGTGNALDHETITNAGTIEVLANGALAIDQGSTVDNSSGKVIVDGNAALTLGDITLSGGAIKGGGTIDVTGASRIDGGATLSVTAVTADAKLTLDGITVSGSVITDNSSIELDNTVKLKDGARIQGASAASKGPITNNGTLEIAGAATLLNDVLTNTGHTVRIDDGQTLTLSGTEISGGTIDNFSGAQGGTIDVTGNSQIDGNATLNKGAVTVENGVTLTLDDATIAGATIGNGGTVKVDASKKLTLAGASLTGGALSVFGTLASSGATTITDAAITNNGLIEAVGGLLTLATITSATVANAGTLRANGAELDIDHEAVTNTGTLAAINGGTLKLISMTVTNDAGAVSVASGSTLDLVGAVIDGGTLTIAGTLESTGTSAINNADITNTGTITVTGGTLTIDPVTLHTITNHALIQVSNGELDVSGDLIVNTADVKAINHGILKLADVTITNDGGTVAVDATSKLYLSGVSSINGGYLTNAGNLYGVSGLNTISAAVTNTGAIEVQAGTLNLSGGLSGAGLLIIDNGATLELAGATAQTITFAGGIDMLLLDKVVGQSFTGTIAGQSTKAGTFTVTGAADITTSSGDALDFTASGGTLAAPANIILTPTGALTGAAKGIVVTQNGAGDISLTATGNITGLAGNGITLRDGPTGAGDITVNNLTGKATGTGAGSVGLLVENLNAGNDGNITIKQLGGAAGGAYGIDVHTEGDGDVTIDAGGNVTGSSIYGIRSRSYGSGSTTVRTEAGSVVTSGSSGIVAVNRADALLASDYSSITVTNYGTVSSGASLNQSGNAPAGLEAGYLGATTGFAANANVYGNVVVNNYGNVTAAGGYGIHAYNYGNGDVTVNDGAGTTVIGADIGIRAQALNGGTGNVTVTLGANASVKSTTSYGVLAYSIDKGDISVTLASGDSVISGSSGIVAVNYAAAIASGADSTISVVAHGTIHSGSALNGDSTTPGAIIAGYKPGGNGVFSSAVTGDVTVTSDATITADAGYGIEAFTWGVGKVTVTTGAGSSITAAGTAIGTFDHGGGDVTVTNNGSATGAVGLSAFAAGAGAVTIVNNGHITSTSSVGISVNQNGVVPGDPAATGSTHITNTGSVVGATGFAAIYIQENTTGSATIDNSGTIGPAVASSVTSSTYAIFETGGAITINNTGHINGNISVASATFNNNAGGIWTVAGSSVFGNVSSIVNAGEIDLLNGASISVNGTGISNSGDIDSWGTASIAGTIVNSHLIEVHTGTLTLFGSLSGAGSVTIDANATLEIKNVVSQTVTFAGAGAELEIDTTTFGGSIAGFAANEKIDLSTITWDSGTTATYDAVTGNLVVSDTHNHSITLKLIGNYSDAHFITSSDGAGGTIVEIAPVDEWTNPAGGDWNTASNWSLGVLAASYDVKLLAAGEPYTVDSAANVTIHDLTVDSGVTLLTEPGTVFTVNGDVVDNGLIEAGPFSGNDVSTIDIKGNVSGSGAIEISNKAVVEIEGSVSGIVVYYDNGLGTLVLDHAKDFHGLISGSPAGAPLSTGNLIDMKDLAWTSSMSAQAQYNSDTNVTTVDFYNGATTVTLQFLGRDLNWHLQSDGHGGTTVYDPLADAPMTIETGAVLNLSEASAQSVTFANGTGTTGTFAIDHAADFTGVINGFAGDGTTANSDLLDLKDIGFSSLTGVTYTENADHLGGTLTLSDGTDTATIKFAGSYTIDSFHFASDGNGGTLVVDPPTGPTLVGTDGQDQFAFANSTLPVQSTIVDFELGQDKIDLQKFANIHSFSDLGITQQGADTLVTLDDHQSIRLKNLVASSLHAGDFIVANHA